MSFKDLRNFNQRLNQVFPSQNDIQLRITDEYSEERKSDPDGGIDFNYMVPGQRDINLEHPTVNSPVDGKIVFVSGNYGVIKIRSSDGYSHEILHLHSTSVHVGDLVKVGQAIGTMRGRGSKLTTEFAQHVHYQVKDSEGKIVNPKEYFQNENRK